jgi:glycine betaine/proline transport system substrate-binding protein
VLEALGYETDIKVLSVPVTYTSLAEGDVDVFLGNWMPTMEADIAPYREAGTVDTVRANLRARSTRWPPTPQAPRWASAISPTSPGACRCARRQIYGIEPGNDGNRLIMDMIAANAFGLGGFEVVESSEQGMLAQVARASDRDEPIVFLGWEPHPMNANFDLTYLTGGDDWFGPDLGGATVYTNTRAGFVEECPNLGAFLNNLEFTPRHGKRDHGRDPERWRGPEDAATAWLTANPDVVDGLARRRDHRRWRRCRGGGVRGAGSLIADRLSGQAAQGCRLRRQGALGDAELAHRV